jgi:hypothetical protein
MRVASTLLFFRRSCVRVLQASAFASLASGGGTALAQAPTTLRNSLPANVAQQLRSDPRYQRWQYFYQKRAFPYGRIPSDALQAARQDFINKWGMAPGAAVANQRVLVNQPPVANQWTSIGPTPIRGGQFAASASGRVNTIAIHPTNFRP